MWWRGCPTPPCLHLTYFFHMVVALESIHGCLLASCAALASSWATENDPSYSSFLFIYFFVSTRNPSSNQFLSSNDLGLSLGRGILTFTNLYILLSSPLSLLHVPDPEEIPTRRNFGFLVIFSRNHSPKILLTPLSFSWTSTCSGLPSCNRVVL
jgi:hypothetical protein